MASNDHAKLQQIRSLLTKSARLIAEGKSQEAFAFYHQAIELDSHSAEVSKPRAMKQSQPRNRDCNQNQSAEELSDNGETIELDSHDFRKFGSKLTAACKKHLDSGDINDLFKNREKDARAKFLNRLKSKGGKYRYSRYNGLPLRYAGGKSLAVGHVIEAIPDGVTHLVSPFFGGGSVEIACAQELGMSVRGYDVFDILTTYWKVQLQQPRKLADRLSQWLPNATTYDEVKARLKRHWRGEESIQDKVELAAHYWFNHNLSYGPGFLGWMSKIYQDATRAARLIDKVRNFRAPGLKVEHGSFERVIPKHQGSFLYLDPPYYLDSDSRMFRGIYPQRNFPIHHQNFDHAKLRSLLQNHSGGFVLSYNDCTTIREWYSDCDIREVEWQYTLGQGETRIGKNRIENGTESYVKKSHELLICRAP